MRASGQYFPLILFIKLYKVALIFKCDHSNESYWAVFSCDTVFIKLYKVAIILKCDHSNESYWAVTFLWYCVYIAIQSGPNLNMWPFKWKLLSSTFLWYCAYLTIQSCSNLNIIVTSHWICNHFVSLKKKKNYSNWSSGGQATLIKSVMAEKRFWSTYFHINIIELYFFALTILL